MKLRLLLVLVTIVHVGCSRKDEPQDISNQVLSECPIYVRVVESDGKLAPYPIIRPEHVARIVPAEAFYQGDVSMHVELTPAAAKRLSNDPNNRLGSRLAMFCGQQELQRAVLTEPIKDSLRVHLGDKDGT